MKRTEEATVILTTGVYKIAPECRAVIKEGNVYVSRRITPIEEPRCRNCKYFAQGQSKYNQGRFKSNICLKKPKKNGHTGYAPQVREQQRYYSTQPSYRACEHYEVATDKETKVWKN